MAVSQQEAIAELKRRGVDVPRGPQVAPGIVQRLVGTAPAQFALGGSQEAARQLAAVLPTILQAAGQISPTLATAGAVGRRLPTRLPPPAQPAGLARRLGAGAQDIASFIGAGEAAGPALTAARAIPSAARAAEVLSGPAGRVAGTAAFGAATDPNRVMGLLKGLGFGAAGEALPAAVTAAKELTPQFLTDSIMGYLKGGRSFEDNSKGLATDIRNSFKQKKEEAADLYNPLFEKAGKGNISPDLYGQTNPDVVNSYLPDMKNLHNEFIENPTLKNAHDLQSQMGFEVRKLENQPVKSIADTRDMQNWRQARGNLRQDVGNFLNKRDTTGDLANQYDNATAFFRDNVAPYKSNPAISKIAAGVVTNPKNVSTIFKSPSEDIQQIADDLGDEGKKKILFSELGKKPNITAPQLSSEIDKLEPKGLSSYITPTLQDQIDKLPGRIKAAQATQRGAGITAGILAGHGGGLVGEALAGAGGATLSPFVLRALSRLVPGRAVGRAFPAIRRGVTGFGLGPPAAQPTPSGISRADAIAELKRRGVL